MGTRKSRDRTLRSLAGPIFKPRPTRRSTCPDPEHVPAHSRGLDRNELKLFFESSVPKEEFKHCMSGEVGKIIWMTNKELARGKSMNLHLDHPSPFVEISGGVWLGT